MAFPFHPISLEFIVKLIKRSFFILFLLAALHLFAQNTDTPQKKVKIGIALGGGGARGIAHIGILKAFEEEGIPIDLIAGTSMGSIIGGLYVAGYSSEQQIKIVKEIDWNKIFSELPERMAEVAGNRIGIMEPLLRLRFKLWKIYLPAGLNNGQRISDTLFAYTSRASFAANSDFNNLYVPFRAVAVDTATGKAVALGNGELAQAIRASMAIPLVFDPAHFKNRLFIDGGVLDNLPTDVVKKMGADIIIACDVDEKSPLEKKPENIAAIARQTFAIATLALKKKNVELADIYIHPDLKNHSSFDYSDFDTLIEAGYKAAMGKMDEIKKLIAEKNAGEQPEHPVLADKLDTAVIKDIQVIGLSRVRKPVVINELPFHRGDTYNSQKAMEGIQRIYATGLFENVWMELDNKDDNGVVVTIHVIEKYPRTIGFGARYEEDEGFSGFVQIIHYNLLGWGERFMPSIRYGDIHKHVGLEIVNDQFMGTPLTLNNSIYFERNSPYLYNTDGDKTGQLQTDHFAGKFSIGTRPYRKLLFMTGIKGEHVRMEENEQLGIASDSRDTMTVFANILLDTTDDRYFPHKGVNISSHGQISEDTAFQNVPYLKFKNSFDLYIPAGKRQSFNVHVETGNAINELPVYEKFKTGGPYNLPGYQRNELWSKQMLAAGLHYRLEFIKNVYFHSGISFGTVGNSRISFDNAVTGFTTGLYAKTPIGPVRIIYGWSGKDENRLYLSLGYDF